MTEHELVQRDLQLAFADPVVGASQPLLQVTDRSIRQWDDRGDPAAELGMSRALLNFSGGSSQILRDVRR